MKNKLGIFLFLICHFSAYSQGKIDLSKSNNNQSNHGSNIQGHTIQYKNLNELKKILINVPDSIEQIVIEDNNIKAIPEELFELGKVKYVQIISTSVTQIDKGFIAMKNLEVIECILDSIDFISPKIYKAKSLSRLNIDAKTFNPNLKIQLPIMVHNFEKRDKYFIVKAGSLLFETNI